MNILEKSIEELENSYWGEPPVDSYVVGACHKARQKPLKLLSNEEIRLLAGQKIGLKYILPIAVEILKRNAFIEITYFEGDLLLQILRLDISDWEGNTQALDDFKEIVRQNMPMIAECKDISVTLAEKHTMSRG